MRQFHVLASVPFYFWLSEKSFAKLVDRSLIRIGVVFFAFVAFGHIQGISVDFEGLVTTVPIEVGVKKLNLTFINLIFCLFLSRYVVTNRMRELVFGAVVFSANFFGDLQRAVLAAMVAVFLYALSIKRSLHLTLRSSLLLTMVVVAVTANDDSRELIISKFGQASKIFTSSEEIEDFSVSARVREAEIGLEGFYNYPISGFGLIRNSLKDEVYGEGVYFFLSDIGVVGILHALGLLGLLVFFFQARLIWRLGWNTSFQLGIKLFLALYWLVSLSTGGLIFKPLIFTIGVVLYEVSKSERLSFPKK